MTDGQVTIDRPAFQPADGSPCTVCNGAGGWRESTTENGKQVTVWRICQQCPGNSSQTTIRLAGLQFSLA